MYSIGIDLHKETVVVAVEGEDGPIGRPFTFPTSAPSELVGHIKKYTPFCAVIEASASYRWLYDLLIPFGEVKLAHPFKLRAIVSGRAKTDKLDAALLAKLLRGGFIPESYVPPEPYQALRDITRARSRLVRSATEAKNELHNLLTRQNIHPPYKVVFGIRGRRWLKNLELGFVTNGVRDELLRRLEHFERELKVIDAQLEEIAVSFPEHEALVGIHGIGLYSALLIVGEIGEPERFYDGRKVAAYAGLTARVSQSGGHSYLGHITRQGSSWLRWILVQIAFKVIRRDEPLKNFYTRIRKRSGSKIARVAVARKLAEICWIRLKQWHRVHAVLQPA